MCQVAVLSAGNAYLLWTPRSTCTGAPAFKRTGELKRLVVVGISWIAPGVRLLDIAELDLLPSDIPCSGILLFKDCIVQFLFAKRDCFCPALMNAVLTLWGRIESGSSGNFGLGRVVPAERRRTEFGQLPSSSESGEVEQCSIRTARVPCSQTQ